MKWTPTSKSLTTCQICHNDKLESVQFFAFIPPVNQMPTIGTIPQEQRSYPLELFRCPKCSLGQIGCEVDAEILFPPEYPYLSGSTKILRENFADLYRQTHELMNLSPSDLCIDIGSNDGTLLTPFKNGGHKVLGIEPSQAGDVARKNSIDTITAYFSKQTAMKVASERGKARVITAANVFAHIGNVHDVVEGVLELLAPKGVFVSESHYFLDLVETIQYDTVYHEHLRYYSLTSLKHLFDKHGLDIFKVQRIPTHGGSVRVYTCRKGDYRVDDSVKNLLGEEEKRGLVSGQLLDTFKKRVIQSKLDLMSLVRDIKNSGGRIFGIGAPSRASTLINYVGLDDTLIDCIVEISGSHKIGKYMPGTRIPVVEESLLFKKQPEFALLLSWHISDELRANLKKKGFNGKFITPLPEARIL